MTTKKFSQFPDSASGPQDIIPVGLQNGANVKVQKTQFGWWITQAIAQSFTWAFGGNISATNLSGSNTGDETTARIIALGFEPSYVATASGTNTYTASTSPSFATYLTNTLYTITFTNGNTGAATLNLNSLGAKGIQYKGAALAGGEIPAGATVELLYDGTQFQIVGVIGGSSPAVASGQSVYVFFA
jgi:hypothetical protein